MDEPSIAPKSPTNRFPIVVQLWRLGDRGRSPIPFSYPQLIAFRDEMSTIPTPTSASLALVVIATAILSFTVFPMVQNTVAQENADGASERSAPSTLRFHPLNAENTPHRLERAKITGGWLVTGSRKGSQKSGLDSSFGVTFVPDPEHQWDGASLR
jgi:hypothetical protein